MLACKKCHKKSRQNALENVCYNTETNEGFKIKALFLYIAVLLIYFTYYVLCALKGNKETPFN